MDKFGERLRRLRKDFDITQGQLAEVIGVVSSAVGKYERVPNSYPSVDALVKISNYFNVTTDYLLKGAEVPINTENTVQGSVHNSSIMQANGGGVIFGAPTDRRFSPEALELMRIYDTLGVRDRLKLLNLAVELEERGTE